MLSQWGTGGETCMPGITCSRVDSGSDCPPDTWSCKPVIKASFPAALGVSKSIFWVWASERVSHNGNSKGPEILRVWGTSFPIWGAMDLKEWRNMLQPLNSLPSNCFIPKATGRSMHSSARKAHCSRQGPRRRGPEKRNARDHRKRCAHRSKLLKSFINSSTSTGLPLESLKHTLNNLTMG